MKTRIISAFAGIALFAGVIAASFYFRYTFSIFVALLNCIAAWEIFSAVKMTDKKPLLAAAMIVGAAVPFFGAVKEIIFAVCFAYIVFNFAYLILHHKDLKMEQMFLSGGLSIIISASFSALCRLFDMGLDGNFGLNERDGIFLVVFAEISPKKTVEGFVGGVICGTGLSVLLSYIYQIAFSNGGRVNFAVVALCAFLAAFAGTLGDLTASVLKREYGIKDYGKIMPGHGGVLDRFDSVFLTAPLTYLLVEMTGAYFPIIIR